MKLIQIGLIRFAEYIMPKGLMWKEVIVQRGKKKLWIGKVEPTVPPCDSGSGYVSERVCTCTCVRGRDPHRCAGVLALQGDNAVSLGK